MPNCDACKWYWDEANGKCCHNEWIIEIETDCDDDCPFFDSIEEVNEQYEPEDIWN